MMVHSEEELKLIDMQRLQQVMWNEVRKAGAQRVERREQEQRKNNGRICAHSGATERRVVLVLYVCGYSQEKRRLA